MVLLLAAGELGPPREEIAVQEVEPVKPVIVILLLVIVSFTSDGVPEVDWKIMEPEAATRSTFIVLLLMNTKVVTVAFWNIPINAPVLLIVDPVVFRVLYITFTVAEAAVTSMYVIAPEPYDPVPL